MRTRKLLYFKASHPYSRKKEGMVVIPSAPILGKAKLFYDLLNRFSMMPSWPELDKLLLPLQWKLKKQVSSDRKETRKRGDMSIGLEQDLPKIPWKYLN